MAEDPTGATIADTAPDTLADKAEAPWRGMAVLAVAAGAQIGFGSIAFLVTQATAGTVTGPVQLLSGLAFSTGLMMVMVTGAELFTGNTMFALPATTGRLPPVRMAAAWALVWFGNLAGSLAVAGLFVAAGGAEALDGAVADAAAQVTRAKLDKGPWATVASGMLANMLVCLAVWMAMGAKDLSGRLLAVAGPVTVFVAAGLEHSIANMSLIPIGLMAGAEGTWTDVARNLTLGTVGNIAGGAAVAFAFGYGHRDDDRTSGEGRTGKDGRTGGERR